MLTCLWYITYIVKVKDWLSQWNRFKWGWQVKAFSQQGLRGASTIGVGDNAEGLLCEWDREKSWNSNRKTKTCKSINCGVALPTTRLYMTQLWITPHSSTYCHSLPLPYYMIQLWIATYTNIIHLLICTFLGVMIWDLPSWFACPWPVQCKFHQQVHV